MRFAVSPLLREMVIDMHITLRLVGLVIVVTVATGCGFSGPTAPTASAETPVAATAASPLPPIEGRARTFSFDAGRSGRVSDVTRDSRFILYDNGAFVLEYAKIWKSYRGAYTEANGVVTFEWEGWSAAGRWAATGTLDGDALMVRYNIVMNMSDFDDAGYVLERQQ